MKRAILSAVLACAICFSALAQQRTVVSVNSSVRDGEIIPKELYGQFSEHLGSCIYGGLWVGEDSEIPNIDGYRKDVFEALKALKVPVMRWPGGCFGADPKVAPEEIKDLKVTKEGIEVNLPPVSVASVSIAL